MKAYVAAHREELLAGKRKLLFLDECFLVWGDACGYTWGKRNERVTVAIGNTKARQTYYGALDARSGEMTVVPYCVADQLSTIDFLLDLQLRNPGVKLTICWDNASWHTGAKITEHLEALNAGLPPEEWPITCLNFAPHAPEQNPIEEGWRQGKTHLRSNPQTDPTFADFAVRFEGYLDGRVFNFGKLQTYGDLRMN